MKITDAMREAAPAPLYGCATQGCAEQKSVRAAELRWYRDGFYCETCADGKLYDASLTQPFRRPNQPSGATLAVLMHSARPGSALHDAIPEAVYSCACHECAVEVSYPADMLRWYDGAFYCYECIDEMVPCPDDTPESEAEYDARHNGPSLAAVLASQAPVAVVRGTWGTRDDCRRKVLLLNRAAHWLAASTFGIEPTSIGLISACGAVMARSPSRLRAIWRWWNDASP